MQWNSRGERMLACTPLALSFHIFANSLCFIWIYKCIVAVASQAYIHFIRYPSSYGSISLFHLHLSSNPDDVTEAVTNSVCDPIRVLMDGPLFAHLLFKYLPLPSSLQFESLWVLLFKKTNKKFVGYSKKLITCNSILGSG